MTDHARLAAFDLLAAVDRDGAYANLAMPALLRSHGLRGRDAGFATELAYGALRGRGWYDAVIGAATKRDIASLEPPVAAVLRIGAHQWLGMQTPAHAVVSTTVTLAKEAGLGRASGLVNACMRRITERTPHEWRQRLAPGASLASVALRTSHPVWVAKELEASLKWHGRDGQLETLLDAQNEPAAVALVARPGLIGRGELAHEAGGVPGELSPYAVVMQGGAPGGVDAVRSARAGVQDEGSQVVAAALTTAAARQPTAGERWLDACAGPGGKAALLGAIASERGATVDAIEFHAHRAELVRSATAALPAGVVTVATGDATTDVDGRYDRILIDAPCSGLGALRRRPEARWRKEPGELPELVRLQKALVAALSDHLTPGGVIAYVTCSPLLAETVEVARGSGLQLLDARAALAEVTGKEASDFGAGPDVQLWTHVHGTDCMYLALLSKAEGR